MLLYFVYFRIEVLSCIVYIWCIIKDEDDEIEYELCVCIISHTASPAPVLHYYWSTPAGYTSIKAQLRKCVISAMFSLKIYWTISPPIDRSHCFTSKYVHLIASTPGVIARFKRTWNNFNFVHQRLHGLFAHVLHQDFYSVFAKCTALKLM